MPFTSESQRRFMWANHPDIAQRWSDEMKRAGQSQKGLPYHKKGGHMAKRKVRFSDVAAQMKGGKHRHRGKRAAPDGSNAMQTDRNELATDHTSPAGVTRHGRHGRGSRDVHMKKALEMLMKSKGKRGARSKA